MTFTMTSLVMAEQNHDDVINQILQDDYGDITTSIFHGILTSQWPNVSEVQSSETPLLTSVTSQSAEHVTLLPLPLLQGSPWLGGSYVAALFLLICVGTVGNILIIGGYFSHKGLNVVGAEFILNLAVADIIIAAVALPMCLVGAVQGPEYFEKRPVLCEAAGFMCLNGCVGAILSVLAVSVNRFFFVCYHDLHELIYNRRNVMIMVVAIWIMSMTLDLPHFLALDRGHYFDPDVQQCMWNRTASPAYTVLIIVLIMLSVCLMPAIYVVIFIRVRKITNDVTAADDNSSKYYCDNQVSNRTQGTGIASRSTGNSSSSDRHSNPPQQHQHVIKGWKMCKTLMVVVLAYLVCWLPYCIVVLIDLKYDLPMSAHLWVTLLAHTHSSISFLIYSATSGRYSQAYSNVVCIRALTSWLMTESTVDHVEMPMRDPNLNQFIRPRDMYGGDEQSGA